MLELAHDNNEFHEIESSEKSNDTKKIEYINIGDKYMMFKNIEEYIFNTDVLDITKKVCFESTL